MEGWLHAAGIADHKKAPVFRAIRKGDKVTKNPMTQIDDFRMIRRSAIEAAPPGLLPHVPRNRHHDLCAERGNALARVRACREPPRCTITP